MKFTGSHVNVFGCIYIQPSSRGSNERFSWCGLEVLPYYEMHDIQLRFSQRCDGPFGNNDKRSARVK